MQPVMNEQGEQQKYPLKQQAIFDNSIIANIIRKWEWNKKLHLDSWRGLNVQVLHVCFNPPWYLCFFLQAKQISCKSVVDAVTLAQLKQWIAGIAGKESMSKLYRCEKQYLLRSLPSLWVYISQRGKFVFKFTNLNLVRISCGKLTLSQNSWLNAFP